MATPTNYRSASVYRKAIGLIVTTETTEAERELLFEFIAALLDRNTEIVRSDFIRRSEAYETSQQKETCN